MTDPKVGVVFRPQSPPERLRDVVQAAESAGIAQLWLWEDCFAEGGLTTAAAALAWTQRLPVGIGLLPVPLRNPAVAAMEIATLSRMFPSRFVPGIGHGVQEWMGQVGARVASPITLLREYATTVRDLLHGRTVDVSGHYVHLDKVALDWPAAEPPPLLIGGRGPKTVRLAGQVADGVILDSVLTFDQIREGCAWTAESRAAAGRTDEPFDVVVFVELDPTASDLRAQINESISTLAAIGASTIAFQASSEAPDPEPLIAACEAR